MADWQGTFLVSSGTGDQMSSLAGRMQKREEERLAQMQKRKQQEKEQSFKVQESLHHFLDTFRSERLSLESSLAESTTVEHSKLAEHFDDLSQRVSKLHRYVSESAMFLPPYELKTAQNLLVSLQSKIQEKRDELLPKKKFTFRSSNKKSEKKLAVTENNTKTNESVEDSKSEEDLVIELAACKFVGASNEVFKKSANEINQKDIALAALNDCTVILYGAPLAIHINKLKNCKVFCGPVPGSVFIRECTNCTFILACQQLRIHSTVNSHFYIHVTSKAIVEDSYNVKFAPYNWKYDGIEEHYALTGLSRHRNNWDQVDDFNWLAADAHSPNWSILEDSERISVWNV